MGQRLAENRCGVCECTFRPAPPTGSRVGKGAPENTQSTAGHRTVCKLKTARPTKGSSFPRERRAWPAQYYKNGNSFSLPYRVTTQVPRVFQRGITQGLYHTIWLVHMRYPAKAQRRLNQLFNRDVTQFNDTGLVVDKKILILRPVMVFYFKLLAQTRVHMRRLNRINLKWICIAPDSKFALFKKLFWGTQFRLVPK